MLSINSETKPGHADPDASRLKKLFLLLLFFWTLLLLILALWQYNRDSNSIFNLAITEAKTAFDKDAAYRHWVAIHGGVYVPVTEKTPPNPYLSNIPERDITTPSGRKLTLINGAYMARQIYEFMGKDYGSQTRITSLNPLRPENAPDEWEKTALQQIEKGKNEVWAFQEKDGVKSLRYIQAFLTQKDCLKCHGSQGYKEGDVRGGISILIPWDKYQRLFNSQTLPDIFGYFSLWAIGFVGIIMAGRRTRQYMLELKNAEDEKREMERRLLHAQKLESLGVMASGIAHDFNNLLMAVQGNLELALEKIDQDSSERRFISNAIKGTNRAAELTRQMLAYSGKGHYTVDLLNINEIVQDNIDILRTAISKKIMLRLNLDKDIPVIEADAGQIQQIVINLITNAAESIGDRDGVVTITTGVSFFDKDALEKSRLNEKPEPGRYVWLEVSDPGCGMSAHTLQNLFDPFFTTKFTGRGLGMSAVLGIIRRHEGAIFVKSELEQGTTVFALFPLANLPESRQPAVQGDVDAGKDRELFKKKVMVVDDEDMVREVCVEIVKFLGFDTIAAHDGNEAVALFRAHNKEIGSIILDLTMPGISGAETFAEIRKIDPEIKIIVASGYSHGSVPKSISGERNMIFIQKPFVVDNLKRALLKNAGD
ncbi:MAG: DUF3365 domain-containing protein [Nitrospiraceae bacterium]|nr:DUF3365 domain-containing protein [Nitrospiraceae bacterium]